MSNINKFNFRLFLLTIFFTLFFQLNSSFPQTFWAQTNGPFGGTAYSICMDSNHTLYAACKDFYKSINNGETWTKINIPNRKMFSVVYHSNGTLFAASYDGQIFRSLNSGVTWELVFNSTLGAIFLIIQNNGNIFAMHFWYGLYRSTDNGDSWIRLYESDNLSSIYILPNSNIFVGKVFEGLMRSTNNGINWQDIAFNGQNINSITGNSKNQLFVSTEDSVFMSQNNGENWNPAFFGMIPDDNMNLFNDDNNLLCSSRYGLFRSTNSGINWINISNEIGDDKVISFCRGFEGDKFAGAEGKGIYRTFNNGLNWQLKNTGINNSNIQSVCAYTNDIIITGANKNGLFYSTDRGDNWLASNIKISEENANYLAIGKDNNGILLAAVYGRFYNSTDSGKSWNFLSAINDYEISSIICNSFNHIIVTCRSTGYGMYKSTNGGVNWNIIYFGGQGVLGRNYNSNIYCSNYSSLHRSTNEGNNWVTVCTTAVRPTSISFDTDNNVYLGFRNIILKSTNNGFNWVEIFNRNIFSDITTIKCVSNKIFALVDNYYLGMYYSSNNGDNWMVLQNGLENYYPESFDRSSGGNLFCGTYDAGVFYASENLISVNSNSNELPRKYELMQNYPNPFNPETNIKFIIPIKSDIKITVYDIKGSELVVLANNEYLPGKYNIKWNAESFPSGIYFCRMTGHGFNKAIKLMLLK